MSGKAPFATSSIRVAVLSAGAAANRLAVDRSLGDFVRPLLLARGPNLFCRINALERLVQVVQRRAVGFVADCRSTFAGTSRAPGITTPPTTRPCRRRLSSTGADSSFLDRAAHFSCTSARLSLLLAFCGPLFRCQPPCVRGGVSFSLGVRQMDAKSSWRPASQSWRHYRRLPPAAASQCTRPTDWLRAISSA